MKVFLSFKLVCMTKSEIASRGIENKSAFTHQFLFKHLR